MLLSLLLLLGVVNGSKKTKRRALGGAGGEPLSDSESAGSGALSVIHHEVKEKRRSKVVAAVQLQNTLSSLVELKCPVPGCDSLGKQ